MFSYLYPFNVPNDRYSLCEQALSITPPLSKISILFIPTPVQPSSKLSIIRGNAKCWGKRSGQDKASMSL